MSVKQSSGNFYNKEVKEKYISKYDNINTQKTIRRAFSITADMEESLNKDLYMFTREELLEFFETTSPKTKTSARNFGRRIIKYLTWAVDTNRIKEHPFPVQQNYFTRYVKNENEPFMDINELRYFTHFYIQNAQDGVILELLFHGIQGREVTEICNLTVDDLDLRHNQITVYDTVKKRKRVVQFEDDKVLQYCLDANKEDIYYKRNIKKCRIIHE